MTELALGSNEIVPLIFHWIINVARQMVSQKTNRLHEREPRPGKGQVFFFFFGLPRFFFPPEVVTFLSFAEGVTFLLFAAVALALGAFSYRGVVAPIPR